jgi:aminopeptidase
MPSGEVFTGPLEDSAEGEVRFNLPAFVGGRRVEGVYLRFHKGEVVEARAQVGEDYLKEALATDPGARRLGEVGIGTNFALDRPTGLILLDEKMGGTVHLALGRSYPETGGRNESAFHWDLVLSLKEGRLLLDGEPLMVEGRFV